MSAEEIVEEVVENVPKLVEAKTMGSADGLYFSKSGLVRVAILAGVAAAGVGYISYKFAQKQTQAKYEQILEKEIQEAKAFYAHLNKEGYETPEKAADKLLAAKRPVAEEAVKDAAEAVAKYQGKTDEEVEVAVEESINVFLTSKVDDEFDYEEELKHRTPERPYIISEEEFMENEPSHSQSSITYYAGDQTLADERDQEIPLVDDIVGEDNLERFGHGSGDARIVFVRNERLSADFEVALSEGKYAHEVLGFEHSDGGARDRRRRNQPRKVRGVDE